MQGGVACYDSFTGSIVWRRPDTRHAQSVHFSSKGDTVWCEVDDGPAQQLDTQTGETLKKWAGIQKAFDSSHADLLLLDRRGRNFVLKGTEEIRVPKLSFALWMRNSALIRYV